VMMRLALSYTRRKQLRTWAENKPSASLAG
jgi:hypothetical protein